MTEKLLISIGTPQQARSARSAGVEVLAEYPNALLVRADQEQADRLAGLGLESTPLPDAPVQTASTVFSFEDAVTANESSPVAENQNRVAYHIVQLIGPAKTEWLEAVAGAGGTARGALDGYRMLVSALPSAASALAELPFVEAVTPYRAAMKISPRLRPDVEGRSLDLAKLRDVAQVEERRQVQVTLFEGESAQAVAETIRASGGEVLATDARVVVAIAGQGALLDLAHQEGVAAILPFEFPENTNDRATEVMNIPADRVIGGTHLTGAGQIVGVVDSGLDTGDPATIHPDLRGRVTILSSPNQSPGESLDRPPFDDGAVDQRSHGTHVAGSVAGDGSAALTAGAKSVPRGVAHEAHVHFIGVGQRVTWRPPSTRKPYGLHGLPLAGPSRLFEVAYAAGARIHVNSWGAPVFGQYDAQSRNVDAFAFTHRDALVIFAAGNSGQDEQGDAQIDPDSIASPATAKNALTVGATENDRPAGSLPTPGRDVQWNQLLGFAPFAAAKHVSDNPAGMALFSSRGPTDDGRIKPEVVAPGTNVLSLRSSAFDPVYVGQPQGTEPLWGEVDPPGDPLRGRYGWSGGTSMAAPLVAGTAALIRQHLTALGHHPSGALLKAYLVNGAVPIAGQYPGEIPAGHPNQVSGFGRVDLLRSLRDVEFSDDPALAVGSGENQEFVLRAADPSAPISVTLCWTDPPSPTTGALQNRLYLRVIANGQTFDGDVAPPELAVNPTQRVTLTATGDVTVQVMGKNVTTRSAGNGARPGLVQDFALVAANAASLTIVTIHK